MTSSILRALSRVTSSGRFITEIDGLRFIAIFGVVAFHTHNVFFPADPPVPHVGDGVKLLVSYLLNSGWFGVQLFFIISGFILALPFAQHHLQGGAAVRLGRYFVRRLTRLEPPYLISLAVLVYLQWYFDGKSLQLLLQHFAAHAVYLHSAIYGSIDQPGYIAINHVAWSLEVEVQFYILAPLLCLVFAISGRWRRRAVIVAGILAGTLIQHYWWTPMLGATVAGQIRWFLLGFLLVDIYLTEWRSAPSTSLWWDVVGAIAWVSWPFILPHPSLSEWVLPMVLLVAYMAAFRGRLLNTFFVYPWVAVIGGMCYTIYLYHIALIWWIRQFLLAYVANERFDVMPWSLLQLLLLSALVVLACVPLFLLFEKPFMRWRGFRRGLNSAAHG